VKQNLELIEIPPEDLRMLFVLLDEDDSGEITIEEFRKGCLKLQGTAKSEGRLI
jgi:Ca2+-binding EF-hand superfamily protein